MNFCFSPLTFKKKVTFVQLFPCPGPDDQYMDLFRQIWTYLDIYGPILTFLNIFGNMTYEDLFQSFWAYLDLFEPIRTYMDPCGPIWTHLAPYESNGQFTQFSFVF